YVAGSVEETAGGLGADGPSYRRLLGPLVRNVPLTLPELLAPMMRSVPGHPMLPLTAPGTGGFGLTLMMIAHAVGWPLVEGGSARLIDALVAELTSRG